MAQNGIFSVIIFRKKINYFHRILHVVIFFY